MSDVTQILSQIEAGDPEASNKLLPLVYEQLRKLAESRMAKEKPGQTLQSTALVHEAYMRLVDVEKAQHWNSRGHFFGAAAEAMRRILVDAARRKSAVAQGGGRSREEFDANSFAELERPKEVIAVHDALDALAAEDKLTAELVKLHYFGGFSLEEGADILGMSRATAYRMWTYAKAWLRGTLQSESTSIVNDSEVL